LQFPELETPRLKLTMLLRKDVSSIYALFSDESVIEYYDLEAFTNESQASEYLLLKVGFKEEGLRRQSGYWKGQFHDLKCFGLIRSEFILIMQQKATPA